MSTNEKITEMRSALIELEAACDAVCALRTQEIYLLMIAVPGTPDALERLDCARRCARELAIKGAQHAICQGDTDAAMKILVATGGNPFPAIATPQAVVEFCAKEIEWMMRGAAAHDCVVLHRAHSRLRAERDKIIMRAGGVKV